MSEQEKKKETEQPKIVVDDDWKAQARAEKEKLSEQVEQKQAEQPTGETPTGPRQLPPANFETLVSTLAAQTLMTLGGVEDPDTKKRYVDLELAQHHIDMLTIIEEKTKGNLTDDEKQLLDQALYELRMQFVQVAQNTTQA